MAISGNYDEIVKAWQRITTADGKTGTRQFHDDTTKSGSLPEIGDKFSSDDPKLIARSKAETHFGGDPRKKLYTFSYSTDATGESGGTGDYADDANASPEILPVTGNLAGEFLAIDGEKSGYIWHSTAKKIKQNIFKKIVLGSFTITKRMSELLRGSWAIYEGCVNDRIFLGFGSTEVLFEGVSYTEYVNNKGNRMFEVNFNFTHKLSHDRVADVWYGWQYIWNEEDLEWDYTDPLLYEEKDLNELFAI